MINNPLLDTEFLHDLEVIEIELPMLVLPL